MSSPRAARPGWGSAATRFALVVCAAWLVVQNAALLLLSHWPGARMEWVVVRALARTGWMVFERVWPVAAVAAVALAVMAWLLAGFARAPGREVADGGPR